MGFYYGSTRRSISSDDIGPIITPREYICLLSGAIQMVTSATPQDSDTFRASEAGTVAISSLLERLRSRLRDRPQDGTAHRMLAIAEFHAGNPDRAIHHLAVALKMRLSPSPSRCLRQSLYARVELALLFPILIRLCCRPGRRARARRLVGLLLLRVGG